MKQVKREYQVKKGRQWETTYIDTTELSVYKELSRTLINKYVNHYPYIKAVKRVNNYDGTIDITINYQLDGSTTRDIFTVRQ